MNLPTHNPPWTMIRHLSYVACDICGRPASPHPDGAVAARAVARTEGFECSKSGDFCPVHRQMTFEKDSRQTPSDGKGV